jgi:hypothetical protein
MCNEKSVTFIIALGTLLECLLFLRDTTFILVCLTSALKLYVPENEFA